jgi:hypothetical protein
MTTTNHSGFDRLFVRFTLSQRQMTVAGSRAGHRERMIDHAPLGSIPRYRGRSPQSGAAFGQVRLRSQVEDFKMKKRASAPISAIVDQR